MAWTEDQVRAAWVEIATSYDGCSASAHTERFCNLVAPNGPTDTRKFFAQRVPGNTNSSCGVTSVGFLRELCRRFGLRVAALEAPLPRDWVTPVVALAKRYGCHFVPSAGKFPTVGCAYYIAIKQGEETLQHWRNVVGGTPGSGPFDTIDGGGHDAAGFQSIGKARPQLRGAVDILTVPNKPVIFWIDCVKLVMSMLAEVGSAGLPGAAVTITEQVANAVASTVAKVKAASAASSPTTTASGYIEGIDVSHYQASARFDEVAKAGIKFVLVKLGEGSHLIPPYADRSASALCARVRASGLMLGGYHYLRGRHGSPQDAKTQAEDFFEAWQRERCEIAELDIESKNNEASMGHEMRDASTQFLDRWDQLSGRKRILIYTSQSEGDACLLHEIPGMSDRPLSVANYTKAPKPLLPKAWKDWVLWQYTGSGRVPGIDGDCDCYRLRGSLADLRA